MLAPRRILLQFLVNRDAFTQPARHLVGGALQRDHVTEFMPQHGFPVDRMRLGRRRAIGSHHATETDAEVTWVLRHAKRANAEILLVGKNLHQRRRHRFEAIFGGQFGLGAVEQIEHPRAVKRGLVGCHPDGEAGIGEGGKARHGVTQGHQVKRGDVIAIFVMNRRRLPPALRLLTQPQEVTCQLSMRPKVGRIKGQRLALMCCTFGKAVLLRQFEPNEVVHLRVIGPELQGVGSSLCFGAGIGSEMLQHGPISPGFREPRVDLEHEIQAFTRTGVVLGIDAMIDLQQQTWDMARIDLEGGFEIFHERLARGFTGGAGESPQQIGVIGMPFQAFRKRLRRQGEVMLFQREFPTRHRGIDQVGIGLAGWIEQALQHHLGIGSEHQRHAGKGHQARRIAEGRRSPGDEVSNPIQQFGRLVRMSRRQTGFAGQPMDPDAARKPWKGIGQCRTGLGIASQRQETPRLQDRPLFVRILLLESLLR